MAYRNQQSSSWKSIHKTKREIFGKHGPFRVGQQEIIEATMKKKDVIVIMPTGGGKSLCYQLPTVIEDGIGIIFTPLIALIEDQVKLLRELKINAVYLNSQQTVTEQTAIIQQIKDPDSKIKFLFLTPEKITKHKATSDLVNHLYTNNRINRIVIDEAHSVTEWGHDFRQDYLNLGPLRTKYTNVPFMALTATSSAENTDNIISELCLKQDNLFKYQSPINRANIFYAVEKKKKDNKKRMAEVIKTFPKGTCGLIYCISTDKCETLAKALNKELNNHSTVGFYHGKMNVTQKTENQRKWSSGELSILVATSAFGMGIDKPDVRFVIHEGMSKNFSNFAQESGRAGRDGKASLSLLLLHDNDLTDWKNMLRSNNSSTQHDHLNQLYEFYTKYCLEKFKCRRELFINCFGGDMNTIKCNDSCDNCKHRIRRGDHTKMSKDVTYFGKEIVVLVSGLDKIGKHCTKRVLANLCLGATANEFVGKKKEQIQNVPKHGFAKQHRQDLNYDQLMAIIDLLVAKGYFTLKEQFRLGTTKSGHKFNKPYYHIEMNRKMCLELIQDNSPDSGVLILGDASSPQFIDIELPWNEMQEYDNNHFPIGYDSNTILKLEGELENRLYNEIRNYLQQNTTFYDIWDIDIIKIAKQKPTKLYDLQQMELEITPDILNTCWEGITNIVTHYI